MAQLGPLLDDVLSRIEEPERSLGFLAVASVGAAMDVNAAAVRDLPVPEPEVPVTALLPRRAPRRGEPWNQYRDDTLDSLRKYSDELERMGIEPEPLVSASALRFHAAPDQLRHLERRAEDIELLELDPLLEATALDDVPGEINLPEFRRQYPHVDGEGVTVVVLDTGVDLEHPHIEVAESIDGCDEPVEIPGAHGTHCAGVIASRDQEFRGVAPGVRLVNLKVGQSSGRVEPGVLARGFDRVAHLRHAILSVSLGFNHRPRYTIDGHGWTCARARRCVVCRALDSAVRREAQLVVVAAGNEHEKAEALRRSGEGARLNTELCCPGQATAAVTVASISKGTFLPASSSSHGPSASGAAKPNIAATGVNVTSTIPVPRGLDGRPEAGVHRSDIFARGSGTSVATPVVAAVAALLAQRMRQAGHDPTPSALRRALAHGAKPLNFGAEVVGSGRCALPG